MELKEIQKRVWKNKLNKGFNITDVNKEFCLLYGEVSEAYDAWKKKKEDLNEIEKNAIESHMFPMGKKIPKYKESWLLTFVDKIVATYEQLNFKCRNTIALYMLFLINMILFGQK